jgi:hypothetical protein
VPPEDEFVFNILMTTNDNWELFFAWWQGLIEGKTKPDQAILDKVAELTAGLSGEQGKMAALFDFVKREIRYVSLDLGKSGYEPTAATEVYENKYGDCKDKSTLLISMLGAAGIPAYHVLIPTQHAGALIRDIPFPFQFNHCIVAIEQAGGYLFLEPTNEQCTFGYLPSYDQDRDVVIFKDHAPLFARTYVEEPRASGTFSRQAIRIAQDGSIHVSVKNTYAGDFESGQRWLYLNESPTQIKERLEEDVDWISAGAQLIEYSHADPLDFTEQFYVHYTYEAPEHCQRGKDILTFRVPNIWSGCQDSGKEERRYPLAIWRRAYRNRTVQITGAEGYEVYALPDPVDIQCPYFKFRSRYREGDGGVTYTQEYIQKATRVSAEEYPEYRRYCKRMEKAGEKQTIFFIKKE